jgi:hypothetical protein
MRWAEENQVSNTLCLVLSVQVLIITRERENERRDRNQGIRERGRGDYYFVSLLLGRFWGKVMWVAVYFLVLFYLHLPF